MRHKEDINDRYFLVCYTASTKNGDLTGYMDMTCCGGMYLNRSATHRIIDEKNECWNTIITNIIELSESDFNDWKKDS